MQPLITSVRTRIVLKLRSLQRQMVHNDRGYTSESVIWIALLSSLALAVGGIFGPEILDAARSVNFK